jgi:hypothetical protein
VDVRAPLGTAWAAPSNLAYADSFLADLRARIADVHDLTTLLWHHMPILRGGLPRVCVDELLARISART